MRKKTIKYTLKAKAPINPRTGKQVKGVYNRISPVTYKAKELTLDKSGHFFTNRLKGLLAAGYEIASETKAAVILKLKKQ